MAAAKIALPSRDMLIAGCGSLRLKHTFIDVREESEWDTSPRGCARSDPGGEWGPSADLFQEDADYVHGLQARMQEAWGVGGRLAAPRALPSTSLLDGEYKGVHPPPPSPWTPPCAPACNPGSAGHPFLCKRPCRFFLEGLCKGGAECEFCHLPHPKQSGSLDKRNRNLLKKMPIKSRCGLLAAVMRSKAVQSHASEEMTEIIDNWTWQMGNTWAAATLEQVVQPGVKLSDVRRLMASLETMSLANICSVARAYVDSPAAIDTCNYLLCALRDVASTGDLGDI